MTDLGDYGKPHADPLAWCVYPFDPDPVPVQSDPLLTSSSTAFPGGSSRARLSTGQYPDSVIARSARCQPPVASVRAQIARIGGLARAAKYDGREVTRAARLAFTDRWTQGHSLRTRT